MSMPSEVKTASKASVNVESRSRMRKRKALTWSPRSIRRLRAAWGGPDRGRVSSHPEEEEMDTSGAHVHDEQEVEAAQPEGVEVEEIGGQQPGGLRTRR